jgi:hypothetical protein
VHHQRQGTADQTHFISKNTMLTIPPVVTKPVKTIYLENYQGKSVDENLTTYLEWHKLEMLRLAQIQICCVLQYVLAVLIFNSFIGRVLISAGD